jgi:hypothetical protein
MRRFPRREPHPDQVPYFWGGVSLNWVSWQAMSIAGILLGDRVPGQLGPRLCRHDGAARPDVHDADRPGHLDGLRWPAAAVAAYALPLKLNIVVAIVAAVVAMAC